MHCFSPGRACRQPRPRALLLLLYVLALPSVAGLALPVASAAEGSIGVVAIGGRSALIGPDGTFVVRGVPVLVSPPITLQDGTFSIPPKVTYRVRVATNAGSGGVSNAFELPLDEIRFSRLTSSAPPIAWGSAAGAIPQRINLSASQTAVRFGDAAQLRALALDDASTTDVTSDVTTQYYGSNDVLAVVDATGLVRPKAIQATGQVFVAAAHEGMVGTLALQIGASLSPSSIDRDGDGMPDAWERLYGFNPNDPSDASADPDGDGLTNLQEYRRGTNPLVADTDHDGIPDGIDADPLVPDQVPPTVTIQSPANGATAPIGSTVEVKATAADNGLVRRITVSLDGAFVTEQTAVSAIDVPVVLPAQPGTSFIVVTAMDAAGNAGSSAVSVVRTLQANHPPVVDAGPDRTVPLGILATTVAGTVSDDGLPDPPSQVTVDWSLVSGPGAAAFTAPHAITTTVSVTVPGTYTFRLHATDGAADASDDVAIRFSDGNVPAPTDRVHLIDIAKGRLPNGPFRTPLAISQEGRYVLAVASATNLYVADTNLVDDIVLWDRTTDLIRPLATPVGDVIVGIGLSDDGAVAIALTRNVADTAYRITAFDATTAASRLVSTIATSSWGAGAVKDLAVSGDGHWCAVSTKVPLAASDTNNSYDIYRLDLASGTPQLISVTNAGVAIAGGSTQPSLSLDGTIIAFTSSAALDLSDTNNLADVYVRDLGVGRTSRVSVSATKVQANGTSGSPSIGRDGRFVAFVSGATNLVPNDRDTTDNIFLCDRTAGTIIRVTTTSSGFLDAPAADPHVATDGSIVAFRSRASSLTSSFLSTNVERAYVATVRGGVATSALAPVAAGASYDQMPLGKQQAAESLALSASGAWCVVLDKFAFGLPTYFEYVDAGWSLTIGDVRALTAVAPLLAPETVPRCGNEAGGGQSVSSDGRYVAFSSIATDIVNGVPIGVADNGASIAYSQAYVYDRLTGAMQVVSRSSSGAIAKGNSGAPGITPDGRYVVFTSSATNLDPNDRATDSDVYLRDLGAGTTELISVSTGGVKANGNCKLPSVSDDGRFVLFESGADNLVAGDLNVSDDVFLRDRLLHTTICVSGPCAHIDPNDGDDGAYLTNSAREFSGDGRVAVYQTTAPPYRHSCIIAFHSDTGVREQIDVAPDGTPGDAESYVTSVSRDGRYVVFSSAAGNLVAGYPNPFGAARVFLRDLATHTTEIISVDDQGRAPTDGYCGHCSVSADGRYVVFDGASTTLDVTQPLPAVVGEVYLRDRSAHTTRLISRPSAGLAGLGSTSPVSYGGCISDDGSLIVFESVNAHLAPGANSQWHVYATPRPDLLPLPAAPSLPSSLASTERAKRLRLLLIGGRP